MISSPFGLRFERMESLRVWEVTQFASWAARRLLLRAKDNFQDSEVVASQRKGVGQILPLSPQGFLFGDASGT